MAVPLVIGFHVVPPTQEALDFDAREDNRVNKSTTISMGLFVVNGNVRISAKTDLVTSLIINHSAWISVYDAEISSLYLPQMPPLQVPMLLVRPTQVGFILQH
jgi:hypothetical protein